MVIARRTWRRLELGASLPEDRGHRHGSRPLLSGSRVYVRADGARLAALAAHSRMSLSLHMPTDREQSGGIWTSAAIAFDPRADPLKTHHAVHPTALDQSRALRRLPRPRLRKLSQVVIVVFPDGSRVRASSISDRCIDDPERTYGLYADPHWEPTWPADVIAWPDFGLPEDSEVAAQQIVSAFDRARRGDLIEVGCLGGSGRTGTVLACMAVLAGVPSSEAVAWVRGVYRTEAVETTEQEGWVLWFAERRPSHRSSSADHVE